MRVLPSENCIDPPGVVVLGDVTVAVRVTAWLTVGGLGEAVTVVIVPTARLEVGAHCTAPCWSQVAGIGSVLASVLVPSGENVGLLHSWMNALVVAGRLAPGIFCNCVKPSSTRLIGSAE